MPISRGKVARKLFRISHPLRIATGSIRSDSSLVIVGAQKCGTTYLFDLLREKAGIHGPPIKEVHFFDVNWHRGPNWYRSNFQFIWRSSLQIDASPYYMFHPTAISRIALHNPRAKLLVMLRDPVERAYSHYNHNVRNGRETFCFREALENEAERTKFDSGMIGSSHESRALHGHRHFSYFSRGLYALQVSRIYDFFKPENVLLLDSSAIFSKCDEEISRLAFFLNMKQADFSSASGARLNGGIYSEIPEESRATLAERYILPNEALRRITGRHWSWILENN